MRPIVAFISLFICIILLTQNVLARSKHSPQGKSAEEKLAALLQSSDSDDDVQHKDGKVSSSDDNNEKPLKKNHTKAPSSSSSTDDSSNDSSSDVQEVNVNTKKLSRRRKQKKDLKKLLKMKEFKTQKKKKEQLHDSNVFDDDYSDAFGTRELDMYRNVQIVLENAYQNEMKNRAGAKQIYRMFKVQKPAWDRSTEEMVEQSNEVRRMSADLDMRERDASGSALRDISRKRAALVQTEAKRQSYMRAKLAALQQLMAKMNDIKTLHRKTNRTFHKLMQGMAASLRTLGKKNSE